MDITFYNVDTQLDFMEITGALYVKGSEDIRATLAELTQYAKNNNITVINTSDFHEENSKEFSQNPDYINTFPKHCVQGRHGFEYIEETLPEPPFVVYEATKELKGEIPNCRNIILRKNQFDVFKGNLMADKIVKNQPEVSIVYGVATNYCVDYVVQGLLQRDKKVYVISDAIKEISTPNEPQKTFTKWNKQGVEVLTFAQLKTKVLKNRV